MPASIRAVEGPGRAGKAPYLAIDDAEGLLALIQFGAIELHANGARADRPDRPDRLVFDLDPGRGGLGARGRGRARAAASACGAGAGELPASTTGGKGLHLVVPLERRHGWPEAKAFAGGLARAMQADSPGRYTAVLAKAARDRADLYRLPAQRPHRDGGRRLQPARPAGCAGGDARQWADVTPGLDPHAFTLLTAAELAAARADPWADVLRLRQRLPAGVGRARG